LSWLKIEVISDSDIYETRDLHDKGIPSGGIM